MLYILSRMSHGIRGRIVTCSLKSEEFGGVETSLELSGLPAPSARPFAEAARRRGAPGQRPAGQPPPCPLDVGPTGQAERRSTAKGGDAQAVGRGSGSRAKAVAPGPAGPGITARTGAAVTAFEASQGVGSERRGAAPGAARRSGVRPRDGIELALASPRESRSADSEGRLPEPARGREPKPCRHPPRLYNRCASGETREAPDGRSLGREER